MTALQSRRVVTLGLTVLGLALWFGPAWARVGGGESYGGGDGGHGGGDGEAIGQVVYWLLQLTFRYPAIGIPLDLIVLGGAAYYYYQGRNSSRSSASAHALEAAAHRRAAVSSEIEKLRDADPYFSIHPFLDFVGLLYTRVQEARGEGRYEHLAAHLTPEILQRLRPQPGAEADSARLISVEAVVVGAARVDAIRQADPKDVAIVVEFEANFDEVRTSQDRDPARVELYAHENWTLVKGKDTPSKAPEAIASLSCPNCGASGELTLQGRCGHCDQVVNTGRFHWVVRDMRVLEKRRKSRLEVTRGGGQEAGTALPTVFAPDLSLQRHALEAEDPDFSWPGFEAQVRRCFLDLQRAWTEMRWERARAFETDHLFETHRFWIERYREAGLNNRVEEVVVDRIAPAKIAKDAYFEAITVRIFARAFDFTVDRQGKLVAGSKDRKREFSEYWTFIRRRPAGRKPVVAAREPAADLSCPGCGAPISLSQTAICGYCGAKVASGEYGWVVSQIEQDEAYAG